MSTAEVIQFKPKEVRMADLDNGYTRLANDLLEKIISFPLTLRQQNILLAIARKTYGYNKKIDWIGNKQLSDLTGYPETRCSTVKNELIKMKVLITNGRECGINKNVSEWNQDITQSGKTFTKTGKKTFTKTVNRSLPKQVNTKDNITKEKRNNTSSDNDGKKSKVVIDYQKVVDAYNEILGDRLPNVEQLNDKRRRLIKSLMTSHLKDSSIQSVINYFKAFGAKARPFYFGDNKTGWIANFDFVIKESTVIAVREGTISKAEFE